MERFRSLLLSIWREACRHIEIHESAETIRQLLAKQLPLARIYVCQYTPAEKSLTTVAAATEVKRGDTTGNAQKLSTERVGELAKLGRTKKLLEGRDARKWAGQYHDLFGALPAGDVLVGALGDSSSESSGGPPIGVLVLVAPVDHSLDERQLELATMLLEPFSAALENDHRLREIAALRDAAEADKNSLLRRLGRTDISDTVVGADTGLKPVMERVELVSPSDVPVLILGETGTGKEVVARSIHNRSQRKNGPFLRVNCGAIPPELIDSQLFGHEKGSFTGASDTRQGWFERAHGGTLFLDEVGELPLAAQVRLLRVLQDGYVERVGGSNPIHVDVRIVAATHRDLSAMVRGNQFREDLWYRIAVFPILLPPLRERTEDIPALARHFVERAAVRFSLAAVSPSEADVRLMQQYRWPGNIRELGAVIDRAAILGDGRSLEIAKALGFETAPNAGANTGSNTQINVQASEVSPGVLVSPGAVSSLDDAIRRHIERALASTHGRIEGNRGAAAILKINPHTLRARMRKLKIDWNKYRASDV